MIKDEELKKAYQQIASSQFGKIVFADLLSLLGYFSNIPDKIKPENIAIANTILSRLNVFDKSGVINYVSSIIDSAKPVQINNSKEDNDEII